MNAVVNSRTFKSGNSEAVRLPKGLGFGIGTELIVERQGNKVILTRAHDPVMEKQRLLDMLDQLQALPKPPYIEKYEPFEFPDRLGL